MDGEESETEGFQPKGVRNVFQGGGTYGAAIQVVDMGADPPQVTVPGKLSTWGHKAYNRETFKETGGGGIGIPNVGVIKGGGLL